MSAVSGYLISRNWRLFPRNLACRSTPVRSKPFRNTHLYLAGALETLAGKVSHVLVGAFREWNVIVGYAASVFMFEIFLNRCGIHVENEWVLTEPLLHFLEILNDGVKLFRNSAFGSQSNPLRIGSQRSERYL